MSYRKHNSRFHLAPAACGIFLLCGWTALGATLQLEDGRVLAGDLGQVAGVAEDPVDPDPGAGEVRTTPRLVIDDGLRRTFVHKTSVREVLDEGRAPSIKVRVWQNHAERGSAIGVVGRSLRVTPFDEFGRRIFEMPTPKGPIAVIQGITEITPVYTRVRGLAVEPRSYVWDMRMATSSLPPQTLAGVLKQSVEPTDLDQRLQVVRLYLQSERYRDARRELEAVQSEFGSEFGEDLRQLSRLAARRLLEEIELRRDAGQHQLARALLERFPADGVAGDTLQRVRELLDEDDADRALRAELLERLDTTAQALSDPRAREAAEAILAEIRARLTPATAGRLASFRQLSRGDSLSPETLASIAISGWLIGSNNAFESLPAALTLIEARENVRQYLAESDPGVRDELYFRLRDEQGATIERVAELIRRIEPPLPLAPAASEEQGSTQPLPPGCYELSVKVGERSVRSLVQLPPEYDPLSSYPVIVTLGELGARAERQLDYWAGAPRGEAGRGGQAMRRGYVTLSVEWSSPGQLEYGYTAEEHAAVLRSLRDAMRRVAIDPDRVFLTGHAEGGDLAWDLALAHPDAWAGVMPYLAVADRYCGWYWENAEHIPWRLVFGELDAAKVARNSRELDRYLRPRFDATVVEYRGRGYDPLSDDIQRAFDWMSRKRRGDAPEEFECSTLRPWDNYFWWIEVDDVPERFLVPPARWPPGRGTRAASVRGRKFTGNKLGVFTAAEKVTVWLSPDLVDFTEPLEVEHNGKRLVPRGEKVSPDLRVLLEDARTRADRKRPYWAKVESR